MPIVKMVFSSPEAAEEAFYRAMQKGDIELMMAVWAEDDNIYLRAPRRPAARRPGRGAPNCSKTW